MDGKKLTSEDAVQVGVPPAIVPTPFDETQHLKDRKAHLAELEKRVKRTDYSPEKMAKYRFALARARAEVKQLEKGD